jgi:hypothetical protein
MPRGSRDSSVGIATGYGLDGQGVGVEVPIRSSIFFLHVVQTGSGVHPASYPMGNGGSFPAVKAAGAFSSPPASAEVKKLWIYTSSPHAPSWRSA